MASTFKTLLNDDVVNTRTLLHEAIPITGTIASGTYQETPGTELNVKTFSHGMFQSVYDYPFLSSSANHIFDITYGTTVSSSSNVQNAKKINIYNQMAQVLMGYTTGSEIRKFDSDGTLDDGEGQMNQCFFLNFSRLLTKDEIKKNSFRLGLYTSGTVSNDGSTRGPVQTIGDYQSATQYRTSPAGDYGLLFTASLGAGDPAKDASIGLVFYQAGIVVLTSSIFLEDFGSPGNVKEEVPGSEADGLTGIMQANTGSTIDQLANGFRHFIHDIDFNNTIELNSSIYFCRVNHNEFNYSTNPTYLTGSKIRVKTNSTDEPVSYITSIGLYNDRNELMAVAKLSEPLKKTPSTEFTLRCRLDY